MTLVIRISPFSPSWRSAERLRAEDSKDRRDDGDAAASAPAPTAPQQQRRRPSQPGPAPRAVARARAWPSLARAAPTDHADFTDEPALKDVFFDRTRRHRPMGARLMRATRAGWSRIRLPDPHRGAQRLQGNARKQLAMGEAGRRLPRALSSKEACPNTPVDRQLRVGSPGMRRETRPAREEPPRALPRDEAVRRRG